MSFRQVDIVKLSSLVEPILKKSISWKIKTEEFHDVVISLEDLLFPIVENIGIFLSEKRPICLSGSMATQIVEILEFGDSKKDYADFDINIYVQKNTSMKQINDLKNRVLAKILSTKLNRQVEKSFIEKNCLLDLIKVNDEKNNWLYFSLGNRDSETPPLKFDIKIIKKIETSYIFSVDSFEVSLEPFLIARKYVNKPNIICKWGNIDTVLGHLKEKELHMNNPFLIRNGLIRYCTMLLKGYRILEPSERERIEKILVEKFWADFTSKEMMYRIIAKNLESQKLELKYDFCKLFNSILIKNTLNFFY